MAPLRFLLLALLIVPAGAAAQAAAPREPASPRHALEAPKVPVIPSERPAEPATDDLQARRFDPTGEDRTSGMMPVTSRTAVIVVIFRGGAREGQGRLASPAQPVFVGVNLRAGK